MIVFYSILGLYFAVIIIYAIMRVNGYSPKENVVVETKETQFEKFRRYAVMNGFPFDGIEIGGSYFQISRKNNEYLFIDKRSGCVVYENEKTIELRNENIK